MLTLYYNPLSPNARRVWLTLLEKQIPFEPVVMQLNGDQNQPEFLKINPFHHIPVLVDDDLVLVESLAILDYLEAQYPQPALMPSDPAAIARVRMVQLVVANELLPQTLPLLYQKNGDLEALQQPLVPTLQFLEQQLGDRLYFGGEQFTLGDVVVGTTLPLLPRLGVSLAPYPQLRAWHERLLAREVWQTTQLSDEDLEQFRRRVRVLVKLHQRESRKKFRD